MTQIFRRMQWLLANEPNRSISEVEQSLGITNGLIYRWQKQLNAQGFSAFPGNGIEALSPEQKKIRELEKQLRNSEIEREIIEKAVAFFSNTPK